MVKQTATMNWHDVRVLYSTNIVSFRLNRLDEADERESASVLRRAGSCEVNENEWQRVLALPLHSLDFDDTSCRVLTTVCNNSHDVEAVG